jgi:hypothetical protein
MGILVFGLVLLLNFAISIWNAYAVGKSWVEARAAGGWPRLMCWAGAVMSASGFSWCYLIFLVLAGHHFQYISDVQLQAALSLGYIVLIPGILLSGLMIMLDSWSRAFRQGGFLNYGMAAYNTYAMLHNAYSAITGFGPALRNVRNLFGNGRRDSKDNGWLVVVILVAVALAAGILTTTFIIWKVAASTALPPRPTRQQFEDHARNLQSAQR